jgi:hypothetical protein
MDSLVAVELSNRLKLLVQRPLSPTLAFDHPTVAQVSAHLDALLQPAEIPAAASGPSAAGRDEIEL